MRSLIRILIFMAVICLAMDAGLLVDGRTSAEAPALFTTLWRLWQIPFCLAILFKARRPLRYIRPLYPLLPYFGWVIVCAAVNPWDMLTIKGLADLFLPYFVTAILAGWIFDWKEIRFFETTLWTGFWFIVAMAILLGLLGLQPIPGMSDPTPGAPPCLFLGVGSPQGFLSLSACLLFLTLARASKHRARWIALRVVVILVPCTMALMRTFLGGMLAAVMVFVVLRLPKIPRNRLLTRRNRRIALALASLLVVGLLAATPVLMRKMLTPEGALSFSGRLEVWPIYVLAAIQNPIFGLGPNGDVRLGTQIPLLTIAGEAHSDYLMQAICYGVPGLLLWVGGLAVLFRRALRVRNPAPDGIDIRLAAILSLVALGITMTVENIVRGTSGAWMYLFSPLLANLYSIRRSESPLKISSLAQDPQLITGDIRCAME